MVTFASSCGSMRLGPPGQTGSPALPLPGRALMATPAAIATPMKTTIDASTITVAAALDPRYVSAVSESAGTWGGGRQVGGGSQPAGVCASSVRSCAGWLVLPQ